MKYIYIMLTDTGTITSKLIGFYTRTKYKHVSVCINQDLSEFYSFGRKNLYFPLIAGLVIEYLDRGFYQYFKNTECAIYRLMVDDDKFNRISQHITCFLKNKEYYHYNFLGLAGVIIKRPYKSSHSYFCSQFAAELLLYSGIHDFGKDCALVQPEEFKSIPGIALVYEGKLADFASMLAEKRLDEIIRLFHDSLHQKSQFAPVYK